jgi:hypothetical protein
LRGRADENPFELVRCKRAGRRTQGERHHARERRNRISAERHHRRPMTLGPPPL